MSEQGPAEGPARIEHKVAYRVPFADTDAMGIVYYANYLKLFEIGRAELFRSLGHPFTRYIAQDRFLTVVEAHCEYRRPARYDDVVSIRTWFFEIRRASCRIDYEITLDGAGELLATGHTRHAVVDRTGRPRRMPPEFLEAVGVAACEGSEGPREG